MAKLHGAEKAAFLKKMADAREKSGRKSGAKRAREKSGRKSGAVKPAGKPRKKRGTRRAGRMTVGPAIMPKLKAMAGGKTGKTPAALHAAVTTLARAQVATVGKVVELDQRVGVVEHAVAGWLSGRKQLGSG